MATGAIWEGAIQAAAARRASQELKLEVPPAARLPAGLDPGEIYPSGQGCLVGRGLPGGLFVLAKGTHGRTWLR